MANATLYGKGFLKTQEQKEQPKFNLFDTSTTSKPNIYAPILNKGPASFQIPKSIQAGQSVKTGPASLQVPESIQKAQQVKPQVARIGTQAKATDFTQDDINKFRDLLSKGIEPERAKRLILEVKGTQPTQDKGINTGIGGVVEGAISQVPAFISNVASVVPQTLSKGAGLIGEQFGVAKEDNPFYTSGMGDAERLKQFGEASKQAIKKFGIEVDDTTAQKIGEELTNIAGSTLLPGGSGVTKIKGAGVLGTAGKGAVLGAKMTPGYIAGSEGRLPTVGEELTGIAGGAVLTPVIEKVAIPAVTGLAQKGKKYGTALLKGGTQGLKTSIGRDLTKVGQSIKTPTNIATRTAPIKIVENNLGLTPTERAKIETITGKPTGVFVLERNLSKDKEILVNQLQELGDNAYNGITKQLKTIPQTKTQSKNAVKMLDTMIEEMEGSTILKREYTDYIAKLKQMRDDGVYTIAEKNAIRRDFDKLVGKKIFDSKGRVSGAEDELIAKWRSNLSDEIQNEALKNGVDVKAMNDELRTSIIMRDGVLRRLSQENKNNAIGLQDIGIGAILSAGDPITATAIITSKKLLEKEAPNIAQSLYNLNKTPYAKTNLRRGVNINTRDKSNGFSITPSTNVIKSVPKLESSKLKNVKPKVVTP